MLLREVVPNYLHRMQGSRLLTIEEQHFQYVWAVITSKQIGIILRTLSLFLEVEWEKKHGHLDVILKSAI